MTKGVSVLELTTAYSILANQGIKAEPFAIWRVTDSQGHVLYEHTPAMRWCSANRPATS